MSQKKLWMVRVAALGLLCLAVLSLAASRWFLTSGDISQGWALWGWAKHGGTQAVLSMLNNHEYQAWQSAIGRFYGWGLTIVSVTAGLEAVVLLWPSSP